MPVITAAFLLGGASIAGLPPFNGYVSLGLIHSGLQEKNQWIPYGVMLVAQVITMSALGRAAWLAFFRRRDDDYEWKEDLRPGMLAGLGMLGVGCVGCVAFGVGGSLVLRHLMSPAAAGCSAPPGTPAAC